MPRGSRASVGIRDDELMMESNPASATNSLSCDELVIAVGENKVKSPTKPYEDYAIV